MWQFTSRCADCPQNYWVWKNSKEHFSQVHMCPSDFQHDYRTRMDEVKQHASIFLQEQDRPNLEEALLNCTFCGLTFKTRNEFIAHIDAATGAHAGQCPTVDKEV